MRLKQHLSHQGGLLTALARPKAVWAPEISSEPAVSRPCLWGQCYVSAPAAHQAKRIVTGRSYRVVMKLVFSDPGGTPYGRTAIGLRLD